MAQRITDTDLRILCERLNKLTGSPEQPYAYEDRPGGDLVAQVGNFHISYAYGGARLHRMSNTSGGVTTPLNTGHVSKRELWEKIHAFMLGIEFEQHRVQQIMRKEIEDCVNHVSPDASRIALADLCGKLGV